MFTGLSEFGVGEGDLFLLVHSKVITICGRLQMMNTRYVQLTIQAICTSIVSYCESAAWMSLPCMCTMFQKC